jgi:hypothetical protein
VDAVDRVVDVATRPIGRRGERQRGPESGFEESDRRRPGIEAVVLGFDAGEEIGDPIAERVNGIGEVRGDGLHGCCSRVHGLLKR